MTTTKPFEFTRREGEELTVQTAVFEALGAASSCWTPDTGDAVFDDARAREIGDKLVAFIHEQIAAEQVGLRVQQRNSVAGTTQWGVFDPTRRAFAPFDAEAIADIAKRDLEASARQPDSFEWWAVEFYPTIEELGR